VNKKQQASIATSLFALLALAWAGQAMALSDYQRKQITQYIDSPRMVEDRNIFDGERFTGAVDLNQTKKYYNAYLRELNFAVRGWNMLSSSVRGSAEAQALYARLEPKMAWGKAMQAAYPAHAEASKAAEAAAREAAAAAAAAQAAAPASPQPAEAATPAPAVAAAARTAAPASAGPSRAEAAKAAKAAEDAWRASCQDFQDRAMAPLHSEPMTRLILQALEGNQAIGSADMVQQHAEVAQSVAAVCADTDLAAMEAKPCWYVLRRAAHDPVQWCKVAADAPALIRGAVLNHARRLIGSVGSSTIQSVDEFRQSEGWLTFEGPVEFSRRFELGTSGNAAVMQNVSRLLASAGIDNAEQALWGDQKERLEALRQAVLETAPGWPMPQSQTDSYATALAEKQVRSMHPQAKIHRALISRGSYKIHANALGVPDRRTLPGYVLFELPGEPFCQLRSFTLTEQYSGGGTYQPASGVRFGYVRFQSCG
jgi:hypothetical protein